MAYNYVTAAHAPSAVHHALTCAFTHPHATDLALVKSNRLEIHSLQDGTLTAKIATSLYGRVASLALWKSADKTDWLFLSTERHAFLLLAWDAASHEIVTKAHGDAAEGASRPADTAHALVDPMQRLIALHIFDGLLKIIPASPSGALRAEAFNLRFEELDVLDLAMLHGCPRPTLAMLSRDGKSHVYLRTYEINLASKALADGPWKPARLEAGASRLIALPFGGVLALGEDSITYHAGTSFKACATNFCHWCAHVAVDADGTRYLLGDASGNLYVIVLTLSEQRREVVGMQLERLGATSQPSAICYLDAGHVFLGSSQGDSQLLLLSHEQLDGGDYITELHRWSNLGPIVDFVVMQGEHQGQGQLVTCSGSGRDGTLRVLRNGIGVEEHARLELSGVKRLWSYYPRASVPAAATDDDDDETPTLVLAFISETRVLALHKDEIGEVPPAGLDAASPTILFATLDGGRVAQVTPRGVRLLDAATLALIDEWAPPDGARIGVAAEESGLLLVSTGGTTLQALRLSGGTAIVAEQSAAMKNELSCLTLRAAVDAADSEAMSEASAPGGGAALAAAGFWTSMEVVLLSLPSFAPACTVRLPGDTIPRSLLFFSGSASITVGGPEYLLCAMGDGRLLSFSLDGDAQLGSARMAVLGSQPISLTRVDVGGVRAVFASGDRPTLIHISDGKLLYSSVNLGGTHHVSPFSSASLPDTLAIASEDALVVGSIGSMVRRRSGGSGGGPSSSSADRLHVHTIPLYEQPRRIVHATAARALAVTTATGAPSGLDETENHLRLFDETTFEALASHTLLETEAALSLAVARLGSDSPPELLVVGTAFIVPEETEPTRGRILVFEVTPERTLELRHARRVAGAVYALEALNGHLLAGVNNKLQLLEWAAPSSRAAGSAAAAAGPSATAAPELLLRAEHCGHILVLYLAVRGNLVLVGDLMKSISLFEVAEDSNLRELSRDFSPNWITGVSFLDDDTYVGAENYMNLFVARRPPLAAAAAADSDCSILEIVGEYHLGEFVNRFRRGSLTMQVADGAAAPLPTLIFGTISGMVGVIASLPLEQYTFFQKVQASLAAAIKGIGGLSHAEWRSFANERKTVGAHGVIDGELIESYLELPAALADEVARAVGVSTDELTQRVEELARLH